jgi:hypothetical protein
MASLRDKFKIQKKASKAGKDTGWTAAPVRGRDRCPGCNKRFDEMPKAVFEAHVSAAINGKDCPFPRKK